MNNLSFLSVETSMTHIILNIISLIATILGLLISFVVLTTALLRRKLFRNVSLLLCANNYLLVFALGIIEFLHNISTFRGDLGLLKSMENMKTCRLKAYFVFSLISAVYMACILQAIFRLCRIVYPTLLWLVDIRTYFIIIPFTWILSFILISPLHILQTVQIIPGEYICRIPKTKTFMIVYITSIVYGLPFLAIAFTYIQLHRFLRHRILSSHFEFQSRSRRGQRDMFVFRRITIMVIVLGSYGMPCSLMLISFAITGQLVSYFYRTLELSIAACVFTLSLTILYVTPQLRKKFRRHSKTTEIKVVGSQKSYFKKTSYEQQQQQQQSVFITQNLL